MTHTSVSNNVSNDVVATPCRAGLSRRGSYIGPAQAQAKRRGCGEQMHESFLDGILILDSGDDGVDLVDAYET